MAEKYPQSFGQYTLLKKTAQGGMAEIFLAQDEKGRPLAIKRILPHLAYEEAFIRMFVDEARITSRLRHPNVAEVYGQGKHDGFYYIAMEYVEGHSLLSILERAKTLKLPLPPGLISFLVADILAALGCAHAAEDHQGRNLNIVHRDVTPQNVLVSYTGEVKLIDFGVAKARARLTNTEAGFTKGKLAYMSPEQARGDPLDGRSDLFAVGIILYESTTNTRLFNKDGPGGILSSIVKDDVIPPSKKIKRYPRELERIVLRALEKERTRRYQKAEDMRQDLLAFSANERPKPSSARVRDLVHDLFGEPDHKAFLEANTSPFTPRSVPAYIVNESGSVRTHGTKVSGLGHETRVLSSPPSGSTNRSKAKVTVGRASPPVKALVDDVAFVPKPRVPVRVSAAIFLHALSEDLEHAFRKRPRTYLATTVLVIMSLAFLFTLQSGALTRVTALAQEVREGVGATSKKDAAMAPSDLRGGYSIESEPPGASITIDGVGFGRVTPTTIMPSDLRFGRTIELQLQLEGFRPLIEAITLVEGAKEKRSFRLEALAGRLTVTSTPADAEVFVSGKRLGRTPIVDVAYRAGRYTITLNKNKYVSASEFVDIADRAEIRKHFQLSLDPAFLPDAKITVETTPPGCRIYIDDSPVGGSPLVKRAVRPGPHEVRAECAHHRDETAAVTLGAGEDKTLVLALKPSAFGYLTLRVIPSEGTEIRIQDRVVAGPIEFKKIVPGLHKIDVRNEALGKRASFELQVTPDQRIERVVNLLR